MNKNKLYSTQANISPIVYALITGESVEKLNESYSKLITISVCLNHCSITKYIPNQHRYLDNTYSLLYFLELT